MKNPPFCPNRYCSRHGMKQAAADWFVKNGTYFTRVTSKPIQRYRCSFCGITFSSRTFSLDYFTKKTISYHLIFRHLRTSSGIRDMAHILGVSPATVSNRITRLARQAIAIHAKLRTALTLNEDLVADGFESFIRSQYFPNNITLLAGKESQYWLESSYAHLSRKGRMTAYQKKRNQILQAEFIMGRRSIYRSFEELVRMSLEMTETRPGTLHTDEHPQYRKVYDRLSTLERLQLGHHTILSTLPRTVSNDLFTANYLDREIRKDCADHTRETVQFSRNASNCMERLAIYRLFHNYCKPFRVAGTKDEKVCHAVRAGIPGILIRQELKTLFTRRRFFSRIQGAMESDFLVWHRGIATPLKTYAEYVPAYALA